MKGCQVGNRDATAMVKSLLSEQPGIGGLLSNSHTALPPSLRILLAMAGLKYTHMSPTQRENHAS